MAGWNPDTAAGPLGAGAGHPCGGIIVLHLLAQQDIHPEYRMVFSFRTRA